MTHDSHYHLIRNLKPGKIILPIILGLAVVGWFIAREINTEVLSKLVFTWKSVFWLLIAWLCMICRDLGYMIRIRILSDKDLTWRQAFRVIMLWEFTSAITPSTVGGTAVAVVFLHKEGMTVGRSTSVVLATSFLDELYFVVMLPLILGRYISDQIPADPLIAGSISLAIAIIWRIISYYPYLIIGALLVPGWIERKFVKPIIKKR